MRQQLRLAGFALAIAVLCAACSKTSDTDHPLAYAPADSVYVFGGLDPIPEQAADAWWASYSQLEPIYERTLDGLARDLESDRSNPTVAAVAKALRDELRGKFNREGIASLGLSPFARSAIYGIGLAPVLRFELVDPQRLRAFIARVEERAGVRMPTAEIAGQEYWTLQPAAAKLGVLMAIHGRHLVVSLAPAGASDALLQQILGLQRPTQTMLSEGSLERFAKERGWLSYGTGYFDFGRLVQAFSGNLGEVDREFLRAFGLDPEQAVLADDCKTEFAALATAIPRVSFGYAAIEAKHVDVRYVIETAAEHAEGLQKLAAQVPGLSDKGSGKIDFGFGLDLDAFAGFINGRAARLAESPFRCASLAPLNQQVQEIDKNLANPAVFMAGAAFSGLYASLSTFELPEEGEPIVLGKVALASDNPASLLPMAGTFVPQLAGFNLEPGGAPVALPAGLLPPDAPPAHIVLGDRALAISLGAGEETGLAAFVNAAPGNPAPLLHYGFTGSGLNGVLAAAAKASEQRDNPSEAAADLPSDGASSGAVASESTEQTGTAEDLARAKESLLLAQQMQSAMLNLIDRVDFALYATDRGIEVRYQVALKQ